MEARKDGRKEKCVGHINRMKSVVLRTGPFIDGGQILLDNFLKLKIPIIKRPGRARHRT